MSQERVPCPVCGRRDGAVVFVGEDRLHPVPGRYPLRRCACGAYYLSPRPTAEALARHYPDAYLPFQGDPSRARRIWRRWDRRYAMLKRIRAVEAAYGAPPGRLLDVGCATGAFLSVARDRGWDGVGLEPHPEAARYARQRHGLFVLPLPLEAAPFRSGAFDVVTLWDVLEHLPDPRRALRELARLLRPGGLLVLSLPNPTCPEARWFGPHWLGWDVPRHLWLPTPDLLAQLLAEEGFRVQGWRSFSSGYSVFLLSLEAWLEGKGIPRRWGERLRRFLWSPPFRLLALPYFTWAGRRNRTSVITCFARREGG